jgi:hypothetical protein
MITRMRDWIWRGITRWLTDDLGGSTPHLSDYERMRREIRPADVVLVEGRSRVSGIIKTVTFSNWTHAALYVGRIHDIEDPELREYINWHCDCDPGDEPLIIESLLESGTVVAPLSKYSGYHIRICRPKGLSHADAANVVRYSVSCLTLKYDIRQLLDLARFLFPFYGLLPRRWRSSLFAHNSGAPTHTVCSTMIAEAFHGVNFPILPLMIEDNHASMNLRERNSKLFAPADFDYSPYFEIIKYPLFAVDELAIYRKLPWEDDADSVGDSSPASSKPELHPASVSAGVRAGTGLIRSLFGRRLPDTH